MRLVDIDKSIESVKNLIRNGATIEQALDAQPTAYDLEEVVKQLEEFLSNANFEKATQEVNKSFYDGMAFAYGKAIEIVRNGGAK